MSKVENDRLESMDRFLTAYGNNLGNISMSCRAASISRMTYYRWMREHPSFRERCLEVDEQIKDNAESRIQNLMMSKDENMQLKAAMFFLNNKAKDRGYGYTNIKAEIKKNEAPSLDEKSDLELLAELQVLTQELGVEMDG